MIKVSLCVCVHVCVLYVCIQCQVISVLSALCNPMDCSLPVSFVGGIFLARILEWVAISFFRDLPNPRIKPRSLTLQVATRDALVKGLW